MGKAQEAPKEQKNAESSKNKSGFEGVTATELNATTHQILQLQRMIGNKRTRQLIQKKAQQQTTPTQSGAAKPGVIQRWTDLGYWQWDHPMYRSRHIVRYHLRTGSQEEWDEVLPNSDDSDHFERYLKGFLEAANDPDWASATRHPRGFRNFENTVSRPPNDEEIMNFMRSLYSLGNRLDLPDGGWWDEGGSYIHYLRAGLANIIRQYGGRVLQEQGETGRPISEEGVKGLANEGGRRTRMAMIENAGATAMKGVDVFVTAYDVQNEQERDTAQNNASAMIFNAARTIRYTLDEHNAAVAFNQAIIDNTFDLVWGTIPGGGTLTSTAKDLLKLGFKQGLSQAAQDDGPSSQANSIADEFTMHIRQVVPESPLTATDANALIAGFEALRR